MNYKEIRPKLETGDIVLFSGEGIVSNFIKVFTASPYSHVGMVVKIPEWDMVLLWESTTLSKIKDVRSGTVKQGVQLVPLSERVKAYKGTIGVRFLSVERTYEMRKALAKLRKEVAGRPYEEDKLELFKSAYDFFGGKNEEELSSLFCSEMVAEGYQRMGFLEEPPKGLPSNEYTPANLAAYSLKLIHGDLSPVIRFTV